MPNADDRLLHQLSQIIGREAKIEGRVVRVVDVLRENATLVLAETEQNTMQESLYGQARRHAPRHFQVPLCSIVPGQLHPVARALLNDAEQAVLQNLLSNVQ